MQKSEGSEYIQNIFASNMQLSMDPVTTGVCGTLHSNQDRFRLVQGYSTCSREIGACRLSILTIMKGSHFDSRRKSNKSQYPMAWSLYLLLQGFPLMVTPVIVTKRLL